MVGQYKFHYLSSSVNHHNQLAGLSLDLLSCLSSWLPVSCTSSLATALFTIFHLSTSCLRSPRLNSRSLSLSPIRLHGTLPPSSGEWTVEPGRDQCLPSGRPARRTHARGDDGSGTAHRLREPGSKLQELKSFGRSLQIEVSAAYQLRIEGRYWSFGRATPNQ